MWVRAPARMWNRANQPKRNNGQNMCKPSQYVRLCLDMCLHPNPLLQMGIQAKITLREDCGQNYFT